MRKKVDNTDNPASKICEIRSTGMNVFEGMGGHVRPSNRVDSTMATSSVEPSYRCQLIYTQHLLK